MANTYPYISGPGALVKTIEQFRKSFPAIVDAAYFKRMQLAPGNESYLINIIRFLGLIDDSGARVDGAANAFYGTEEHFKAGFSDLVSKAYAPVFTELGPDAWTANRDRLSHWFRMVDKTTDLIGGRQASTFLTLAGLTGNGAPAESRAPSKAPTKASGKSTTKKSLASDSGSRRDGQQQDSGSGSGTGGNDSAGGGSDNGGPIGLSVRIEINVPVGATRDEYDAMFASIRKHLYPA